MSDAKIRLKAGSLEIEFEGSEGFIAKHLTTLVEKLPVLLDKIPSAQSESAPSAVSPTMIQTQPQKSISVASTSSIASKISVKSGTDLAIAACAKLQLVDGLDSCDRKTITSEMRGAKHFFKENYAKNLSSSLKTLVKSGTLNEIRKDTYTLSHEKATELRGRLA